MYYLLDEQLISVQNGEEDGEADSVYADAIPAAATTGCRRREEG